MKTRIYFLLAKVLLELASFCRVFGIRLDYYRQICVIKAISRSKLTVPEKIKLLGEIVVREEKRC
jgi:hypothetical protein